MPWNNQSDGAGGDGPRGPWSREPSGNGSGVPPDLENLLQQGRERLRRLIPDGGLTRRSLAGAGLALVGLWLLSGVYFVSGREQGIVQRFGAVVAHSGQGINYHLPWPIETAQVVEVTPEKQLNVGYLHNSDVSDPTQAGDVLAESLMLTGDENIIDVNFTVSWAVKDASANVFDVDDPDKVLKAVAESAMREVVGQSQFESIAANREIVQKRVRTIMQKALDLYGAGITVIAVQLGNPSAPGQVNVHDVQAARADEERMRDDAQLYANQAIPAARGQAAEIVQKAEAYREKSIAEAGGEAKRFLSVYQEYKKAPAITRRRIYLETMSRILAPMKKVIIDDSHNIVSTLPLSDLLKGDAEPPGASKTPAAGPGAQP